MHASHLRECFGTHQGCVARQNKGIFGAAAQRATRHQQGVAGPALWLLNDDLHTQRLENGGDVLGAAAIVDRSNGTVDFGVPFASLISLKVEAFEPDKLPPDLAKSPAVKPGSK